MSANLLSSNRESCNKLARESSKLDSVITDAFLSLRAHFPESITLWGFKRFRSRKDRERRWATVRDLGGRWTTVSSLNDTEPLPSLYIPSYLPDDAGEAGLSPLRNSFSFFSISFNCETEKKKENLVSYRDIHRKKAYFMDKHIRWITEDRLVCH